VWGGTPSQPFKAANPSHPNLQPFGTQQLTLHLQVSAVSAERPACGNHAMTRDAPVAAVAHDVADRSRRPRLAGKRGDITIGGDVARRNTSHG
jgi:hypothetical protein